MLGLIYYVLSSTTLPYNALVSLLNGRPEITIQGVRGTLRTGIELDRIEYLEKDSQAKLHVKNFKTSDNSFFNKNEKKVIHIKKVSMDTFELIKGANTLNQKSKTESEQKLSRIVSAQNEQSLELRIDHIVINNVAFKHYVDDTGLNLSLLHLKNLVLGNQGLTIDQIDLASELVDANGKTTMATTGEILTELDGLVKASQVQLLTKDFTFKLKASYKKQDMSVELAAFDQKLLLKLYSNKEGRLTLKQLELNSYLDKQYDLSKVTGTFALSNMSGKNLGSIKLLTHLKFDYRDRSYTVQQKDFAFNKVDDYSYEVIFRAKSSKDLIKLKLILKKNLKESQLIIESAL